MNRVSVALYYKISHFWDACITYHKFKVVISALKQQSSSHIPAESHSLQTMTKSIWYTRCKACQHAPSKTNASSNNSAAYAFLFLSKCTCSLSPASTCLPFHFPTAAGAFPNPVKRGSHFPRLSPPNWARMNPMNPTDCCPPYWARMNPMNPTDCCRTDWLWKHAPADPRSSSRQPYPILHSTNIYIYIYIYIYMQ